LGGRVSPERAPARQAGRSGAKPAGQARSGSAKPGCGVRDAMIERRPRGATGIPGRTACDPQWAGFRARATVRSMHRHPVLTSPTVTAAHEVLRSVAVKVLASPTGTRPRSMLAGSIRTGIPEGRVSSPGRARPLFVGGAGGGAVRDATAAPRPRATINQPLKNAPLGASRCQTGRCATGSRLPEPSVFARKGRAVISHRHLRCCLSKHRLERPRWPLSPRRGRVLRRPPGVPHY
jgi:hypothetical protein